MSKWYATAIAICTAMLVSLIITFTLTAPAKAQCYTLEAIYERYKEHLGTKVEYAGERAQAFLREFHKIPPPTNGRAQRIFVAKKNDHPNYFLMFENNGCYIGYGTLTEGQLKRVVEGMDPKA